LFNGNNNFTSIAQNKYGVTITNTFAVNLPQTVNLGYDNNGNLTNDGTRVFGYNVENQLTNVSVPGRWRSDFVYDGLGRRRIAREYAWSGSTWLKTNEVRIVYDGYLPIQERDSNNNVLVTYTRGLDLIGDLWSAGGIGGLLARTDVNGATFYHHDGAGNITALMDGEEDIVARYMYGPFGKPIGQWGAMVNANEMQFSSMPRDPFSGLSFYAFRAYEPNFQRWLNQDPIQERGGINLYRPMNNNPISRFDPLGLALPYDMPDGGYGGGGSGGGDVSEFEAANAEALLSEAKAIQNQIDAERAAQEQFEKDIAPAVDETTKGLQNFEQQLNGIGQNKPPTSSPTAKVPCPNKTPALIGQNMKGRVQPLADYLGFDTYKPSKWFNNLDDLNKENMQWINQIMDEERPIYDIGPDPNLPPSSALQNEMNEINNRNYPVIPFNTSNGHGI
jgi:RHS repeat-associated protein